MDSTEKPISGDRTDRPTSPGLLTVNEILTMATMQQGLPKLQAGDAAAIVRWVHVSDSDRVASLLDGGELLLTTGAGWDDSDAALRRLVDDLTAAGLAGIVLELGTRFVAVPPALVRACRVRDLVLVTLDREVKFVSVTEQVHRRIIASQLQALEQRQRLHELFTALSLRGAAADVIVRETARALDAPVVLENLSHEVVFADTRDVDVHDALRNWPARSRASHPEWTAVPVEARGVRWGTLIALEGSVHPAGRATVLEQAATALALSRLADGEGAWEQLSARELVASVIGVRDVSPADTASRLEAAGFPVHGRTLQSLSTSSASAAIIAESESLLRRELAGSSVLGSAHDGEGVLILSLPTRASVPESALTRLASVLSAGVAVGIPQHSISELLGSLSATRMLASQLTPGEVRRVDDRPLTRLIAELHGDHRVQAHSERMLEPLIQYDLVHNGDLVRVLRAVVAHPSSRTAAASASHLSRSVFYQRIALISELLGADLDDGETLASLHLAVLARGR